MPLLLTVRYSTSPREPHLTSLPPGVHCATPVLFLTMGVHCKTAVWSPTLRVLYILITDPMETRYCTVVLTAGSKDKIAKFKIYNSERAEMGEGDHYSHAYILLADFL